MLIFVHGVSHVFHNEKFSGLHQNAIYLKLQVDETELFNFFRLIKSFPFKGFSVTMPLKEKIIQYLNKVDAAAKTIQAINTLVLRDNKWIGFNTDASGALDAIEEKILVKDRRIVKLALEELLKQLFMKLEKEGQK